MIDEIKKTFKKRVKEHEWIDEKTTKSVFQKANMLFHALQIKSSFPFTVDEYSSYGFRESNIVAVWGYSIAPLQMTLMLTTLPRWQLILARLWLPWTRQIVCSI